MIAIMPYVIGALMAATVLTLFLGLGSMTSAGDFNKRNGNKLMRLRVGLQLVTVLVFMAYLLMTQG